MAGHSQFKNIMHRKGAQDAKRGKIFTKLLREISVAAREGGVDPEMNARLRTALDAAKEANMPKDNIDRALKKVSGGEDSELFEEVRYEGYGPGGVALIIETVTDNRNRTASEIRSLLNKNGGSLGETNSVAFQFDHIGYFLYPSSVEFDHALNEAVEAGASDVQLSEEGVMITCSFETFSTVREKLKETLGAPCESRLAWSPKVCVPEHENLRQLVELLEDNDDVQVVWHNAD